MSTTSMPAPRLSPSTRGDPVLLNPHRLTRRYRDDRSAELMGQTVEFFEKRGKEALKRDEHDRVWPTDFLDFLRRERIFATMLTPTGYGRDDCRWDTYRICEFAEILGFYGLPYWYPFQVTVLGLGPIWMSGNEEAKRRAGAQLEAGEVFAFGLSERAHGADVYSTDMVLTPDGEGGYRANGVKYYIGNGNAARMVSTFGKFADSGEYVFFAADSQHPNYELIGNVINSQNYVSTYALRDYPVNEANILHRGDDAWNAALNTVNVGKYNLGSASVGIGTHAFYEAINHAGNRVLYGRTVTDFPHVRRLFTDAYARLVAMKLVTARAGDYMRTATREDRRYLLYNPLVKARVTSEGERVLTDLWDVIAAKGVEKDTFFEAASRDIRWLPRLEGTVHVNTALMVKFMPNYLFAPDESLPQIGVADEPVNDEFLFDQGPTRGLGKIKFRDYRPALDGFAAIPNVAVFRAQVDAFVALVAGAPPTTEQQDDIDFSLAVGQLFALLVYAGLVLEAVPAWGVADELLDEMFSVFVRDFNGYATDLLGKTSTTSEQAELARAILRPPAADPARSNHVWEKHVFVHKDIYEMNP